MLDLIIVNECMHEPKYWLFSHPFLVELRQYNSLICICPCRFTNPLINSSEKKWLLLVLMPLSSPMDSGESNRSGGDGGGSGGQ